MPEAAIVVEEHEGAVRARYPDGTVQSVRWRDVERIEVQTNDTGPWGADVWWVLYAGGDVACAYPQGATGESALIARFQVLEGFDTEALIKAMGCTENAAFVVWVRPRTT